MICIKSNNIFKSKIFVGMFVKIFKIMMMYFMNVVGIVLVLSLFFEIFLSLGIVIILF